MAMAIVKAYSYEDVPSKSTLKRDVSLAAEYEQSLLMDYGLQL